MEHVTSGHAGRQVRFDDMLATVLARQPAQSSARVTQWRQLLDLVAQQRFGDDAGLGRATLARLEALRADVPVAIRREAALAVADRPVSPFLVGFLASDVPQVAGEVLSRARLNDEDWLHILPMLSPTARGYLRHRRDLTPILRAALAGFGATDLALETSTAPAPTGTSAPILPFALAPATPIPELAPAEPSGDDPAVGVAPFQSGGEGQIRAIISRIARFRTARGGYGAPASSSEAPDYSLFHFETGQDGIIRWIEGVPREALIGETLATPAASSFGVDGQAPGAFRRRSPFRDARLMVAGNGPTSGEWRIAGVPVFAPGDGRFLGYRGTGRRPRRDERAETLVPTGDAPVPVATPGMAADSLRQLVHELRTPLNAISGFAEMIRRQMRGPVSTVYRDRAQSIADQAGQLLTAVDDLDVAARLDSARLDLQRAPTDVGALLHAVCADHRDLVRDRGATLACQVSAGLPRAFGDAAAMRRMIARLVASATAIADGGETIRLTLDQSPDGSLRLGVTRPARLAGVGDAQLLDPGYGPEGDWPDAPLLGLGFSLHLVRRLALAAGGALLIDDALFTLCLPTDSVPDRGFGA